MNRVKAPILPVTPVQARRSARREARLTYERGRY